MSPAEQPSTGKVTPDVYRRFEGQRTPSDQDYLSAVFDGLIVVDANVLLDLYRYNEMGRRSLLSSFRAFEDRLWIPHQAMHEFWNNRADVLRDPQGNRVLLSALIKTEETAVQSINIWAKQSAQTDDVRDEVSASLRRGFKLARKQIEARSDDSFMSWLKDTNSDPVLQELESLLQGKIGDPLSPEEYATCLKEAGRRIDAKEPPGYKDKHKSDPKAAGDYLIWAQILREGAKRKTDVLFVTRDLKEDWVREKEHEMSGPRPELVKEMLDVTGRMFLIRSPAGLLELARTNMSVEVSDESLDDARRLNDTESSFPQVIRRYNSIRRYTGWDVASAENLLDALEAGNPPMREVLVTLATGDNIIDKNTATEIGIVHFDEIRSDLDNAIQALKAERLISHNANSPMLPIIKRQLDSGKIGLEGVRLREEFHYLLKAILTRSDDLYLWQYLDDDRLIVDHLDLYADDSEGFYGSLDTNHSPVIQPRHRH